MTAINLIREPPLKKLVKNCSVEKIREDRKTKENIKNKIKKVEIKKPVNLNKTTVVVKKAMNISTDIKQITINNKETPTKLEKIKNLTIEPENLIKIGKIKILNLENEKILNIDKNETTANSEKIQLENQNIPELM